jgi:hypothetical protein
MPMPAISTDIVLPRAVAQPLRWLTPRRLLLSVTCFVAGVALVWGSTTPKSMIDADLARVLRFMAGLKLAFAALALVGSWWRLSRPAEGWRTVAYVAGPPLAFGSSILMLSLTHLSLAALGLHAGLFAVVVAALSDERFFSGRSR